MRYFGLEAHQYENVTAKAREFADECIRYNVTPVDAIQMLRDGWQIALEARSRMAEYYFDQAKSK